MKVCSFCFTCLVLAILVSSAAISFGQSDPGEFRGHKWGSTLDSFGEMVQIKEEYPTLNIFTKANEELVMGGVEVASIVYFFANDRFAMAQVVFDTEENFKNLIKVLEALYGKGIKTNYPDTGGDQRYERLTGKRSPNRNRYWWVLEQQKLSLYIEYFEKDRKGQIYYFFEGIVEGE
jgi:hypothetical protein